MNIERFRALAESVGVDTYGDAMSESGWGASFAFDLCYALSAYLAGNHGGQWTAEYSALSSLFAAPISFAPGMTYFDPEEENEEYEVAREVYSAIEAGDWKPWYGALVWFSKQDKGGRK